MRCSKCGAELSEDTKFCSYCGNKVEMPPKQENVSEEDIPPISLDEQVQDFQNQKEPPKSLADRMREKVSAKWGKLSTYGKIATVAIVVFALLFIVALLSEKTAATIIAVLQIALAVVAVLMHRGIIKIEQKKVWLKWLLLGIAALLTVLNVMSYSWEAENKNSNPDIDKSRSYLNFHLLEPERKYRAEAERQIKDAGCRTRSDSVRLVEALVTATPEFFKGKKKGEIKAYFQEALGFIQEHQDPKTIISAVVHMDEKTPHMHLCFVPLTEDKRLSAKEIVGNKKKLTQWQDRFWEHMVKKYPDLERGESASETGRDHIPPRVFKEMTRLTKQKAKLEELLSGVNAFNAKGKAAEIGAFLDKYIPAVEQMHTTLKKYNTAFTVTTAENKKLKKKTEQLEQSLDKATQESTLKKLADAKLHRDYEDAVAVLDRIPQEVLAAYTHRTEKERETAYGR